MLEAEVATLKARLISHDALLQQITQYSELQSELIQRHEVLIYRLMKREPAMGETSCKEDELRMKGSNDEDDDPSTAKEGEQPTSTTQIGVQTSAQGESAREVGGSGSGKGVMEGEETIEALLNLDELMVGDEGGEDEELEEGEFLPTDVEHWKPNDEVLPDHKGDIDEHVVLNQSKKNVVIDTIGGEMFVDLSEIQNAVNEEERDDVNEPKDVEPNREELKRVGSENLRKPRR